MLLAFIIVYILATIAVGWWASRFVKNTQDFVVAGKTLPVQMVAFGLFATWFGSETVIGASTEFLEHGFVGNIEDPIGSALCLVLVGTLVAKPLYKLNLLTFSDFFRIRFNKYTEVVSAFFMIPSYFSWIAAQLVALSLILTAVADIPREYGVIICSLIVVLYTFMGGMWSVAVTDFVQTIVIVIGLSAMAIEMLMEVGGFGKMWAAIPTEHKTLLPKATVMDGLHWFAALITIGLGSIPQQDVFQRVMSAKSEKTAIQASYISAGMYLTVGFLHIIIAFCGKMLYPELAQGDLQALLPNLVLKHSGLGMQILFFGALLSAILSTCSGAILAPATVVGENLIKPLYKDLTDKQLLWVMRMSIVVIAIITCVMATLRDNIFELVGESSALSLVSLFVPLIAGLYWKKASTAGAMASMMIGMAAWLITLELATEVPPMLYGFLASTIAMFVFSMAFPKKMEV